MKIQDILTDESKWTKGWNARNKKGAMVQENARNASRFCLYGAVWRTVHLDPNYDFNRALDKIRAKIGRDIFKWNDNPRRKFKSVRALIEELDI